MWNKISTEKELGAFIHDARIQSGLTQEQLAVKAGVSRKWLIGLEQGVRRGAELRKVLDLLAALEISVSLTTEPDTTNALKHIGEARRGAGYPSGISQETLDALIRADKKLRDKKD